MYIVPKKDRKLLGFTFIDLFCGIGGFHLALSSFGAECVFASEINKSAREVYNNNFNMMPSGNICEIKESMIPKHDILCAGFPCQPFSISGNKKGFNDRNGTLFFEIIRIASYHKPKVLILENVKNLEKHDNGNTFEVIKKQINDIGYDCFYEVLNATNFEVPQSRKRIYIVAFRKDLRVESFIFPKNKGNFKVLRDIIEENVDEKYNVNVDYVIDKDDEKICNSKFIERIGQYNLGRQGERIYSVKGQAITLSSQGGGVAGKTGMYLIDGVVRKLTPRECARLMGFNDNYNLHESDYICYKQFGNSVVVDVLQSIVGKILSDVDL